MWLVPQRFGRIPRVAPPLQANRQVGVGMVAAFGDGGDDGGTRKGGMVWHSRLEIPQTL